MMCWFCWLCGDSSRPRYKSLAQECHPDYLGDEGHNICILLNEACEVRRSCYPTLCTPSVVHRGCAIAAGQTGCR